MEPEERLREEFESEGQLAKSPWIRRLSANFMEKARHNLLVMGFLLTGSGSEEAKKAMHYPAEFEAYDWAINAAYYAMYMAAQACLAKLGFSSKNHTATILAIEVFFVKKKMLEPKYLQIIEKAHLEKEYVHELRAARTKRETAQYDVTEKIFEKMAKETAKDAYGFVEKIEELLDKIE